MKRLLHIFVMVLTVACIAFSSFAGTAFANDEGAGAGGEEGTGGGIGNATWGYSWIWHDPAGFKDAGVTDGLWDDASRDWMFDNKVIPYTKTVFNRFNGTNATLWDADYKTSANPRDTWYPTYKTAADTALANARRRANSEHARIIGIGWRWKITDNSTASLLMDNAEPYHVYRNLIRKDSQSQKIDTKSYGNWFGNHFAAGESITNLPIDIGWGGTSSTQAPLTGLFQVKIGEAMPIE